jgi:hypothetical protein
MGLQLNERLQLCTVKSPFTVSLGSSSLVNTKLKKVSNGGNLTLIFLRWYH